MELMIKKSQIKYYFLMSQLVFVTARFTISFFSLFFRYTEKKAVFAILEKFYNNAQDGVQFSRFIENLCSQIIYRMTIIIKFRELRGDQHISLIIY